MNDMSPIKPVAFDYSALSDEIASEARSVAERIRARHQSQIAAIIETGRDLASIKESLGHGHFGPWLEAEFGWSARTAQRYMQTLLLDGKSDTVSYLPPTALFAITAASTPAPVRLAIIERSEAGEKVDPIEVRDLVKEAKAREREERQIERLPVRKQRDRRKASERRAETERQRIEAHNDRVAAEREAALEAAQMVEKALGDELPAFIEKLKAASVVEFRRYFLS